LNIVPAGPVYEKLLLKEEYITANIGASETEYTFNDPDVCHLILLGTELVSFTHPVLLYTRL
jgi:hypothetical protein